MANNFVALSVVGGSLNTWGTTLNTLLQAGGIGALTAELYNDGGTLKLSMGKIGINNGVATGIGVAIIDTITTISTAGMTAGLWHSVEMSVSGTAVTLTITPIVGANDESVIDAATKAAYDYEKTGYYLTASKRLIGVVFLRAALALGRIVNCESGKLGFKGIEIEDYISSAGVLSKKYIATIQFQVAAWNMDTTNGVTYNNPFSITNYKDSKCFVISAGGDIQHLEYCDSAGNMQGSSYRTSLSSTSVDRLTGGNFDSATWNAAIPYITITYET
jgi:hypothetical protein